MTEAYTSFGDSWQTCRWPDRGAQTFRPLYTHTLFYVDLQLKADLLVGMIVIQIYEADANHKPKGDMLSDSYGYLAAPLYPFISTRVRMKMRPFEAIAGHYYAIVLHSEGALPYTGIQWRFDAAGATYPRGMRSFTMDGGVSWTVYSGSDFMFAEFGSPPTLPVPVKPPVDKFVPTLFEKSALTDGVRFHLATNVPCHLTCYWTASEPKKHPVTRVIRGLVVPWYTYFCFVAWHAVAQVEPGDTLYHTFHVTPWEIGQKRWFTFRGNVDDVLSPSVGPVFNFIRTPLTTPQKFESYEPEVGVWRGIYGSIWRGQTFTPVQRHVFNGVYLLLSRGPYGWPDLTIDILLAPDDEPTGMPKSSRTFSLSAIPRIPDYRWVIVPLAEFIAEAGTKYGIILHSTGSSAAQCYWRADIDAPTYPRGISLASTTAGDRWDKLTDSDHSFQDWGAPFY